MTTNNCPKLKKILMNSQGILPGIYKIEQIASDGSTAPGTIRLFQIIKLISLFRYLEII